MPRISQCCGVLCSAVIAGTAVASANGDVVVEGSHGNATVGEILGRPATFTGEEQVERKSFQLYLPPNAKQGPDVWYTIRLDVSVTFAAESDPGSVLVTGYTNGRAAAQVEFYSQRGKDGRAVTIWDSVDVFEGNRSGRVKGRGAEVHYENLLQISGVRPGLNKMSFETEAFDGADVESVVIGPASGVYASPEGPAELKISGEFTDDALEVGEAGELEVRVASSNSRSLEDVQVSVQPRSAQLFIDGTPTRRIAELGEPVTAHFTVGRSAPGPMRVQVGAVAANGVEATTLVRAEVGEEGESGLPWGLLAGLGALACAGAAFAIRNHRRREAVR